VQLAGEHLNRDRSPCHVTQQPVDDLRRPALAVARVPELRQRAGASFEVAGGHVVEHHLPVLEMPSRQAVLDTLLALPEPVHRQVQIILIRVIDVQFLGQRGLRQRADRAELRRRRDHASHDHRHAQVPLSARLTIQQSPELQPAGHRQRGVDVTGRQGPLDLKRLPDRHQRLPAQHPPDRVDRLRGQMGEVGQRFLLDLSALAIGAPKQRGVVHRLPRPPLRRDHVHRPARPCITSHALNLPHLPDR
jgi:hypothetical protein